MEQCKVDGIQDFLDDNEKIELFNLKSEVELLKAQVQNLTTKYEQTRCVITHIHNMILQIDQREGSKE